MISEDPTIPSMLCPLQSQLLNEHSGHEVHLFEANDRAGGHANTMCYQVDGADVYVDM